MQGGKRAQKGQVWDFLAIQWLGLGTSTAGGLGLISVWELRSCKPHGTVKNK